jgi:hypothetical protein
MTERKILFYNLSVGACDSLTGVLLVFFPLLTLKLMGIESLPVEPVYLSFVGVFVFSVGISYFIPYLVESSQKLLAMKYVWIFSSLVRFFVAIFVVAKIINGNLVLGWFSVAFTDLAIAFFQFYLLKTEDLR